MRRLAPTVPIDGGCIFAERPDVEAPDARILWRADLDPGAIAVAALPVDSDHPDAIQPASLAPWLTIVRDATGEHAVLSDGRHHIRIDVERGSLAEGHPVLLHYRLCGTVSAQPKILPLRRLLDLCRYRRFAVSLYPPDPRIDRWITALRVHDAIEAGASQREIGQALFGRDAYARSDTTGSDSLRSRVRRLIADARRLAGGDYRLLMQRRG